MDSNIQYINYNGKEIQINEILAKHERISSQIKKYFHNCEFHKLYNLYEEDFKILPFVLAYHFKEEDKKVIIDSIIFQEKHHTLKIIHDILLNIKLPYKQTNLNDLILESELNLKYLHESKYELCALLLNFLKKNDYVHTEIMNNEEFVTWVDNKLNLGKINIDYSLGDYEKFYIYNSSSEILCFYESIEDYVDRIKSSVQGMDSNNPTPNLWLAKDMIFANRIINDLDKKIELFDQKLIISILKKVIEKTNTLRRKAKTHRTLGHFYLEIGEEKKAYEQFKNALNINPHVGVKLIYDKLNSKYGSKNEVTLFNYSSHPLNYSNNSSLPKNISFKNINLEKYNFNNSKIANQKSKFLFNKKWRYGEDVAIKYYKNLGYGSFWSENNYWKILAILLFWDVFYNEQTENDLLNRVSDIS